MSGLQLSLLGVAPVELTGAPRQRHALDGHSWVDIARGALSGGDLLLGELVEALPFLHGRRVMYHRVVDEPRLTFHAPLADATVPEVVRGLSAELNLHYGLPFDHLFVNYYRDGRDSVAWHRDRVGKVHPEPLVAVLSIGAERRFLLRPSGGGRSTGFTLGSGDLLVMGGRSQQDWEHSVPKMASAGPRMSITLRAWDEGAWWESAQGEGAQGPTVTR